MIKILNSTFELQAILTNLINSNRFEEINGENTLTFSAILDAKASTYIDENSVFEHDDDYFDMAYYKKSVNADGTLTIEVEDEHVSYRLNDPDYDKEFFTLTGTPAEILTEILDGTSFTVGTVDYTDSMTYSAQEKKSRRQLLMEFVTLLGGELLCNKFEIGIVAHRGSTEPKIFTTGRNIKVVSKIFNKRETDSSGQPLISYTCSPLELPENLIALGDEIILIQEDLGINTQMRVVRHGYNPYDLIDAEIELANYVSTIEDQLYRIETNTVSKDKLYHGCRIGPTYGFEAIRSDKKARSYQNSTNIAWQSGDGSGENWVDKLYYELDPETGLAELFFAGKFTVEAIEAIKANIDIIVSNTFVTNTLYAEYGRIAKLSVSELNTSWKKITNYLISSIADVLYKRDYEQYSLYIVASTDGSATEQVKDLEGNDLFWIDDTHTGMTLSITEYPVLTYVYTEIRKGMLSFFLDGTDYIFDIELGAGAGNPLHIDWGKAHLRKLLNGLKAIYTSSSGNELSLYLNEEDGEAIVQRGSTGEKGIRNIAISSAQPTGVQDNDLWIATTDYSRYDSIDIDASGSLEASGAEYVRASGTITVTLFTAVGHTDVIRIIKNVGAGTVTIDGYSAETFDGAATITLAANEHCTIISNGANWEVIG